MRIEKMESSRWTQTSILYLIKAKKILFYIINDLQTGDVRDIWSIYIRPKIKKNQLDKHYWETSNFPTGGRQKHAGKHW